MKSVFLFTEYFLTFLRFTLKSRPSLCSWPSFLGILLIFKRTMNVRKRNLSFYKNSFLLQSNMHQSSENERGIVILSLSQQRCSVINKWVEMRRELHLLNGCFQLLQSKVTFSVNIFVDICDHWWTQPHKCKWEQIIQEKEMRIQILMSMCASTWVFTCSSPVLLSLPALILLWTEISIFCGSASLSSKAWLKRKLLQPFSTPPSLGGSYSTDMPSHHPGQH